MDRCYWIIAETLCALVQLTILSMLVWALKACLAWSCSLLTVKLGSVKMYT